MDVISLDEMVYSLWSGDDNGCSSDMIFSRALRDFSKFEIDFRGCEDGSKRVFFLCINGLIMTPSLPDAGRHGEVDYFVGHGQRVCAWFPVPRQTKLF